MNKRTLVNKLKKAKDAYYNDAPIMSDREFDKLEDQLRKIDPFHPVLKAIGAPVKKGKVRLPFHMGSLDKVKPDTLDRWVNNQSGPYVVSDKVDGNSLLLVGHKSHWDVFSRGNGTYGQDLSHLVPYLNLPKPQDNIAVRVEAVMLKKSFKDFENQAENPRNFVSGLLNRKHANIPAMKKVVIIAFELIEPCLKPSDQFSKLKRMGFRTPTWSIHNTLDPFQLTTFLESRREKLSYEIDGLVITVDEKTERVTSGNPIHSVAYKTILDDQIATVEVEDVIWSASRHKALKPRIKIKKTRLSGVTITYLTGFNAKYIHDNKINKGAILEIVRSGDVIPHILQVIESARTPKMPDRKYEWNETGIDIFLPDKEKSKTVEIKKITHFFKIIGVENFSQGWVGRFYDDGLNTIPKILKANINRMKKVEKMGDKMANKIRDGIDSAIAEVELHMLMFASGAFTQDLGSKKLAILCNEFPNLLDENVQIEEVEDVDGFSTTSATHFVSGLIKFKKFLRTLPHINIVMPKKKTVKSNKLENMAVLFTGFRDKELETAIIENGGEIKSSLSKAVTVLLAKDTSTNSGKAKKAISLGIPIMTAEKFRKSYL